MEADAITESLRMEKKADILRFMLNSNAMSLAEYCHLTGCSPDFEIQPCDVTVAYHQALFLIYDCLQVSAGMYPENDGIGSYI